MDDRVDDRPDGGLTLAEAATRLDMTTDDEALARAHAEIAGMTAPELAKANLAETHAPPRNDERMARVRLLAIELAARASGVRR